MSFACLALDRLLVNLPNKPTSRRKFAKPKRVGGLQGLHCGTKERGCSGSNAVQALTQLPVPT